MNATRNPQISCSVLLPGPDLTPVEVIQGYLLEELRVKLQVNARRRLSRRTIERWVNALQMQRNEFGLFEESDLAVLIRMSEVMRPGRKLQQVAAQVRREFLGEPLCH